jgi:Zn-dependent protease with chaperone function
MDLASLYLRLFFSARSFRSQDLDSLASRMGVLHRLSPDPSDRYFITPARGATAANFGNKIVFGRRYYETMTDEQRIAVGAHEFAHTINSDGGRLRVAVTSMLAACGGVLGVFAAFRSVLAAELAFLACFFVLMSLLSSRQAEKDVSEELDCDSVAAFFVSPQTLVSSIRLAASVQRAKRGLRGSGYSTLEDRAGALLRASDR